MVVADLGRDRASPSSSTSSQSLTAAAKPGGSSAVAPADPGPDRRDGVVLEQAEPGENLGDARG